jgi:hypothetical protein
MSTKINSLAETMSYQLENNFFQIVYNKLDQKDAEILLLDAQPGTYLFRIDSLRNLYLTGIGHDGIHHARIEKQHKMWWGRNADDHAHEELQELIALCLGYRVDKCHPLLNKKS